MQKGDTSIHIAVRAMSKRVTEILLRDPKNGRLLYKPNKAGETPYMLDAGHPKSILTEIFGAREFNLCFFIIKHVNSHILQYAI